MDSNSKKYFIQKLDEIILELEEKLFQEDLKIIKELNNSNEWGVAFEILCTQIFEHDVEITSEIFEKIKSLGISINSKSFFYESLKSLVKK